MQFYGVFLMLQSPKPNFSARAVGARNLTYIIFCPWGTEKQDVCSCEPARFCVIRISDLDVCCVFDMLYIFVGSRDCPKIIGLYSLQVFRLDEATVVFS